MSRAPAYNENQYRDYPFLTVTEPVAGGPGPTYTHLPQAAIVDFGCIMGIDAGFEEGDYVYLQSIARAGTVFTYTFVCTNSAEPLIFTRDAATTEEWAIEWQDSTPAGAFSFNGNLPGNINVTDCGDASAWKGFLVTGSFAALLALIPNATTLTFEDGLWRIEPARIQNVAKHYVRSITLLNRPRTIISNTPTSDTPVVVAACLDGNIQFQEGYNCTIRQDDAANRLVFGGVVGGGEGQPCAEVAISPGEQSPDDGVYLTGGPQCGDVLKTINGKGGRRISITAGPGFSIEADPASATLTINRDLSQFTQCGVDLP